METADKANTIRLLVSLHPESNQIDSEGRQLLLITKFYHFDEP